MALKKHIPNLVVLARTLLVPVCAVLLSADAFVTRVWGVALLFITASLDGVDGYLARRLKAVSRIGAQLDTLGDRVTENVLFIFFAAKGVVPLYVPIVFVTRSFLADFVRSLHDRRGIVGTFSMNVSAVGRALVASRFSRTTYLMVKFAAFLAGGAFLVCGAPDAPGGVSAYSAVLGETALWCSVTATFFNIARFAALINDSREVIREDLGF